LLAWLHAADVARTRAGGAARTGALLLAVAVTFQAALGIVTLLQQAPLALALLHQAMAVAVIAVAVIHAEGLARRGEPAVAASIAGIRAGEQAI
jgi:cytochrome c oxidase assembly protein subunit 15